MVFEKTLNPKFQDLSKKIILPLQFQGYTNGSKIKICKIITSIATTEGNQPYSKTQGK